MEPPPRPASHNLFEVYLRLRPPPSGSAQADRILTIDTPEADGRASHITLNPPTDRRRAIEKFAFTHVFDEEATQLDVFHRTEMAALAEGVLAPQGGDGTDAIVATLGVTGSGKTHTILGSRTQRGLTQLALDVLFRSVGTSMLDPPSLPSVLESLQASDPSEALLSTAAHFLESTYADPGASRANSRAATPLTVRAPDPSHARQSQAASSLTGAKLAAAPKRAMQRSSKQRFTTPVTERYPQGDVQGGVTSPQPQRRNPQQPPGPQWPDMGNVRVRCDASAEHVVVVSMYEVHNDRIYDLLTPPSRSAATKELRRRPLLFKPTELSPERKVVAGLRKVVCASLADAVAVLEAGLVERRVAGTGSNSVSSRSHGFFCFEVKRRARGRRPGPWGGSRLTIVDLAGSERAREAKTQGATLVEAGKINESLMYLGQCLQTQSEAGSSTRPNVVPYRQCKLTELLFSNSFPSPSSAARRTPQRGVMIVTADPRGDFNATSQMLRYSALAREVTVPRIPSITATILAHAAPASHAPAPSAVPQHPRPFVPPGSAASYRSHSPQADERATMELAALEIARLSDDMDQLRAELERQTDARLAAEAHLLSAEERMLDLEAAVRDECATAFEERLARELARCRAELALEHERSGEHWDRKVDVLERGLDADAEDKENVLVEDLVQEAERLRRENAVLRRELAARSPGKRTPLAERDGGAPAPASPGVAGLGRRMERLRIGSADGSPTKKMRRLAAKRWEREDE